MFRVVDVDRERRQLEQDERFAVAWHTAALSRVKRLKPLRSYLKRREPMPPMSVEQRRMVADVARRWGAQLAEQAKSDKGRRRRRGKQRDR